MKKALLSLTFAALAAGTFAAGPAMAQATPMLWQNPQAYRSHAAAYEGQGGYVRAPRAAYPDQSYRSGNGVVIDGNRVAGQDPDPNVRLELRRDPVADY
jgi:hypothetical protein